MARATNNAWRRACKVNTVTCIVCSVLATSLFIYGAIQTGGIYKNLILYKGSCSKTKSINLWLHLLLNIFSTGILASTNFFMQILASPSRAEIDKAHLKNTYLSIGIPNIRNIFHMSVRKTWLWALFWITSLPFHFFFNSAVFSTKFMGSDWHLSIASEGFVNGARHFGPGAVLWATGYKNFFTYGLPTNITDYFDSHTAMSRDIQYAADNGLKWKRLEVPDCLSQYAHCAGRETMRNVVWIVKSHNSSGAVQDNRLGWKPTTLLKMDNLTRLELNEWKKNLPYEETNSLWFANKCSTIALFNGNNQYDGCLQACPTATGFENPRSIVSHAQSADSISSNLTYNFFPDPDIFAWQGTQDTYKNWHLSWPGIREKSLGELDLQYCLAEELPEACKVGLSITLVSVVVVCLWIKTMLCIRVLFSLSNDEPPLVVLGDAIASFICRPDYRTIGRCTLDRSSAQNLWQPTNGANPSTYTPWKTQNQSWLSTLSSVTWKATYLFFASNILFVIVMLAIAQHANPIRTDTDNLLEPLANSVVISTSLRGQFIPSILVANCPQLLLSTSYFFYNAIFTRLCVEKEWKSYCLNYKPLRVTNPRGQQRSTYRLQLPYRYSVALICASIALHWVVSNVLYVFVYEGGYFKQMLSPRPPNFSISGLNEDTSFAIGYSTFMLLILLLIIVILVPVPVLLAMKKAQGQIPNGGSNSIVIASACHIPMVELSNPVGPETQDCSSSTPASYQSIPMTALEQEHCSIPEGETVRFGTPTPACEMALLDDSAKKNTHLLQDHSLEVRNEWLVDVSQAAIRWGEVSGTVLWDEEVTEPYMHLSFGTFDHNVQSPVDGKCYY